MEEVLSLQGIMRFYQGSLIYISDKRIVSVVLKRMNQMIIEYAVANNWLMCLNMIVYTMQDKLFANFNEKNYLEQTSE
jgi:hypothetical protein